VSLVAMGMTYAKEVSADEKALLKHEFEVARNCVATNIYHEARSESILAQKAVAFVTLNRVQHTAYPDDPCAVAYDAVLDSAGNPVRYKCQFSWYCDGKSDKTTDQRSWKKAVDLASDVLRGYGKVEDPTDGAVMYHATYADPYWAPHYDKTVQIDTHIFYK